MQHKKFLSKLLAMAVALVMVLGMLPVSAANGDENDNGNEAAPEVFEGARWPGARALNEHMDRWAPRTQNSLFVPPVLGGAPVSYPFAPGMVRGQFEMEFEVTTFDYVGGAIAFAPYAAWLYWTGERAINLLLTPSGHFSVHRGGAAFGTQGAGEENITCAVGASLPALPIPEVRYVPGETHNVRIVVDLTAEARGATGALTNTDPATWNGMYKVFIDGVQITVDYYGEPEWWAIRSNPTANTRANMNNVSRWCVSEMDTEDGRLDFRVDYRTDRNNLNLGTIGVMSVLNYFVVTDFRIDDEPVPFLMAPYYDFSNMPYSLPPMERPDGDNLTFYVGPSHEWRKPQDVIRFLQPGDTVVVEGDWAYPAPIFIARDHNGTPDNHVTFRGVPGATGANPVIGTLNAQNIIEVLADHITIESFIVVGNLFTLMDIHGFDCYLEMSIHREHGPWFYAPNSRYREFSLRTTARGIFQLGHDLVIRYNDISDTDCGILAGNTSTGSITIEYNHVHRNGIAGAAHNIYLATGAALHPDAVITIRYNLISWSMNGQGVKSRGLRNNIYHNIFFNNTVQDLEIIGPTPGANRGHVNEHRQANPYHGTHSVREDSDVVGNLFLNTWGAPLGFVRMGGDGSGHSYGRKRFVNNTFVVLNEDVSHMDIPTRIFRIEFPTYSVEMWNNLIYSTSPVAIMMEPSNIDGVAGNNIPWQPWHPDLGRQIFGANNAIFAPEVNNSIGLGEALFEDHWIDTLFFVEDDFTIPFVDMANFNFHITPEFAELLQGINIADTVHTWPEYDYVVRHTWCDCHITQTDYGHLAPIGHEHYIPHPAVEGEGYVYGWVFTNVYQRDTQFPNPLTVLDSQLLTAGAAWYNFNVLADRSIRQARTDGSAPTIGAFAGAAVTVPAVVEPAPVDEPIEVEATADACECDMSVVPVRVIDGEYFVGFRLAAYAHCFTDLTWDGVFVTVHDMDGTYVDVYAVGGFLDVATYTVYVPLAFALEFFFCR